MPALDTQQCPLKVSKVLACNSRQLTNLDRLRSESEFDRVSEDRTNHPRSVFR